VREKVETTLNEIGPSLLADVKDGVVKLKLTGACSGCPMAAVTLQNGIARVLREEIPEVKEVIAV